MTWRVQNAYTKTIISRNVVRSKCNDNRPHRCRECKMHSVSWMCICSSMLRLCTFIHIKKKKKKTGFSSRTNLVLSKLIANYIPPICAMVLHVFLSFSLSHSFSLVHKKQISRRNLFSSCKRRSIRSIYPISGLSLRSREAARLFSRFRLKPLFMLRLIFY